MKMIMIALVAAVLIYFGSGFFSKVYEDNKLRFTASEDFFSAAHLEKYKDAFVITVFEENKGGKQVMTACSHPLKAKLTKEPALMKYEGCNSEPISSKLSGDRLYAASKAATVLGTALLQQ